MGLAWQQGPLAPGAIGHFLTPEPLPERILFAEPLRRRMRVKYADQWIADSEDVVLLHEPGRYPVAYFPLADVTAGILEQSTHSTTHRDLGVTSWYVVRSGEQSRDRAAWRHVELPPYAQMLEGRVAFAWRAMDCYYEEEERIVGHAADPYHRIDIRQTSRHIVVRDGEKVIADSHAPLVLFESGFAPRWYVPRADIDESALTAAEGQTFCPYKGLCSYYDIGDAHQAAWYYPQAWEEVKRITNMISFEPDKVSVSVDGVQMKLEPGQNVISHGADRNLTPEEVTARQ
ncbi:MAG TPA: DUF427 domain-containing protein [Solirubrobacteraceae bacterium]|jgi:uncharacterized protein (DUF427 family)